MQIIRGAKLSLGGNNLTKPSALLVTLLLCRPGDISTWLQHERVFGQVQLRVGNSTSPHCAVFAEPQRLHRSPAFLPWLDGSVRASNRQD